MVLPSKFIILKKMSLEKIEQILKAGILILAGSLIFSLFVAQLVAIVLLILWLIKIVRFKKVNLHNNPFHYPLIAFIIARIISVFLSTDISQSIQILNKEIFFYSLFFIVVDVFPINDKEYVKKFFLVLIFAAIIASIYGTSKVLLGFAERASSTTSGYGTLGMFLTIAAAVLLVLGSNKYFLPSKLLWAAFLVIVVTGILFTFNRVHWAIIAFTIFVFGLLRERKIVLAISIAAVVLIFAVPALRERFSQLLYFSSNLSDRDIIWQGASKIYSEHPLFGFGPKTFTQIFPLFDSLNDKSVSGWHCDYLQIYMESGLMGLIPFLWMAVSVFYFSIKNLLIKNIDSFSKDLALALLLAMAGFYLTAILGTFISDPLSSLLYQLLLGILAVNYRNIKFTKQ